MAHIDDLVKRVSDPQLRAALAEQVRTLVDRKDFGLVFQDHLPETVRLPKQRVRTGDKVQLRDSKAGTTYQVVSTKTSLDTAFVVELDASGESVGDPQEMVKADLVVVKEFGEPVYPGLRQVGEAGSSRQGQPTHVVINGENFHALQLLEYTHAAKVDLIYIDPPYNTGAADWKYNDRYVDSNDSYRHSKWLSFIERRLRLARRLLKDTGVLVLAIDDNEHHRLRMLADQIFGESNFISNVVWQGGRKNDSRFISNGADYMLVYARNVDALVQADIKWRERKPGVDEVLQAGATAWEKSRGDEVVARSLMKEWFKSQPSDSPVQAMSRNTFFLPDGGLASDDNITWPGGGGSKYEVIHPVTGKPVPIPPRGWIFSTPERMQQAIDNGEVIFKEDHTKPIRLKRRLGLVTGQVVQSVFDHQRTHSGRHLLDIFGDKRFPFPKDHEVLMRWFRLFAPSDAVVVDFFAGSGTTAEAVMRLNAEDGGTRHSILVTNNELSKAEDAVLRKKNLKPGDDEYEAMGVFHHVTKPRLTTVLTGVREDGSTYSDGIDGQNAAFFDLTYEDENLVSLGNRFEAVAPLLWLQSGAVGPIIDKVDPAGFTVPDDGAYAVIFDTEAASEAIDALHEGVGRVFIVTDSESDFRMVVASLPKRLQGNAQHLYSSYLRSFEINRG